MKKCTGEHYTQQAGVPEPTSFMKHCEQTFLTLAKEEYVIFIMLDSKKNLLSAMERQHLYLVRLYKHP